MRCKNYRQFCLSSWVSCSSWVSSLGSKSRARVATFSSLEPISPEPSVNGGPYREVAFDRNNSTETQTLQLGREGRKTSRKSKKTQKSQQHTKTQCPWPSQPDLRMTKLKALTLSGPYIRKFEIIKSTGRFLWSPIVSAAGKA